MQGWIIEEHGSCNGLVQADEERQTARPDIVTYTLLIWLGRDGANGNGREMMQISSTIVMFLPLELSMHSPRYNFSSIKMKLRSNDGLLAGDARFEIMPIPTQRHSIRCTIPGIDEPF